MLIRISTALRSISVMVLLLVFLYVYANLPDQVGLSVDESGNPDKKFGRNAFFYTGLLILTLVNGLFHVLVRLHKRINTEATLYKESLIVWLNGLSGFINLFFVMTLIFLNAFNSLEKVDLDNFGIILNITGGFVLIWLLGIGYVRMQKGK